MKRCAVCEILKPRDRFSARRASRDGLQYVCKECRKIQHKERYRRLKALGICYHCGKESVIMHVMCARCYHKEKRYRRTPQGKVRRNRYAAAEKAHLQERVRRNPQLRIAMDIRDCLWNALKGNYKLRLAVRDLGCTIEEFKLHLESHFLPGMTWDNYGRGKGRCWEIKRVVPLSSVDLTDEEQRLRVCHYTNLLPLWFRNY